MPRIIKKSIEHNKTDNSEIKYKGVRKRKWGKWVSEIRLPNSRERIWLGSYDSPVKAARAFDAAQFCLRGKSANFNFPHNPPEIAGGRSMTPLEIQAAAVRFANTNSGQVVVEVSGSDDDDHPTVRDESEPSEDYSLCYSPSISDETTANMDSFETQLSLSDTLGSGNYVSEFGYCIGLDDFYSTILNYQPEEYDCEDAMYDVTLYQDTYLWNF